MTHIVDVYGTKTIMIIVQNCFIDLIKMVKKETICKKQPVC